MRFAREHELAVAVRGGGHNIAGNCVCDGGLMIDLSQMKGIQVDPERRTARAQPGLTLGEFDRHTQAHGLATTMGIASEVGIAGLTLGGGYGWLAGRYGMAWTTCSRWSWPPGRVWAALPDSTCQSTREGSPTFKITRTVNRPSSP